MSFFTWFFIIFYWAWIYAVLFSFIVEVLDFGDTKYAVLKLLIHNEVKINFDQNGHRPTWFMICMVVRY